MIATIKTHVDGLSEDFDVSVEAIRRQRSTLIKQQRKRNQEARLATRLGGPRVHADREAGVQNLLDLQDSMKEERAVERYVCEIWRVGKGCFEEVHGKSSEAIEWTKIKTSK